MTSCNDDRASYDYKISTMVNDPYADMPPLVTTDGVVVEQEDTSTPRATLDITAGINFPKAPEWYLIDMHASNARSRSVGTLGARPEVKHLNGKSLTELNTSNIKVDVEELSDLSEDEKHLTPAASECDAASIVDINAEGIIDDRILDGVGATGEGITEEGRVVPQNFPKRVRFKEVEREGDQVKNNRAGKGVQNSADDAHIKAMARKYASLQTLHEEKGKLEARHDRVKESMYKKIEKVEQKREGMYKKLAEIQAKHDKVVEEHAAWMASNEDRKEAVNRKIQMDGKKKTIDPRDF